MTGEQLTCHLECYLSLKQALGCQIRAPERQLRDFVNFIVSRASPGISVPNLHWIGHVFRMLRAAKRHGCGWPGSFLCISPPRYRRLRFP